MPVREVAEILDLTPTRIRQLVAANQLPAVRVGGRIRIPRRAFELWLEAQTEVALAAVAQ
jgi:excisionase family DNA binding protein